MIVSDPKREVVMAGMTWFERSRVEPSSHADLPGHRAFRKVGRGAVCATPSGCTAARERSAVDAATGTARLIQLDGHQ